MPEYLRLLALSDNELAHVDPLVMNLLVARSVPALADLDIPKYQWMVDRLAQVVEERLPDAEEVFRKSPEEWRGDVNFARLVVLNSVVEGAGVRYREDHREAATVSYTDPADLFLNGVLDTRRGTCANLAALYVAVGRRLGWPVSLAAVHTHFLCRYDDGRAAHNVEATRVGVYPGMLDSPWDDALVRAYRLPPVAVSSGSDLRALTPREELGVCVGFRARHMWDTGRPEEAELDYLLARRLYPRSRWLYRNAMALALSRGATLFEPGEAGSPQSVADEVALQSGCGVAAATYTAPAYSTVICGVVY